MPYGTFESVEDTPYDFRIPETIGSRIIDVEADFPGVGVQLQGRCCCMPCRSSCKQIAAVAARLVDKGCGMLQAATARMAQTAMT